MISTLGADLLLRVLDEVEKEGVIGGEEQNKEEATYAPMIKREDGEVDWTLSAEKVVRRLRGLSPWPGLYTWIHSKRIRILCAEPLSREEAVQHKALEDLPPGTISAFLRGVGFSVATGEGHLLITRLCADGKAAVDADAFINGYRLKIGERIAEKDAIKC